jgi:hypothetical protein
MQPAQSPSSRGAKLPVHDAQEYDILTADEPVQSQTF